MILSSWLKDIRLSQGVGPGLLEPIRGVSLGGNSNVYRICGSFNSKAKRLGVSPDLHYVLEFSAKNNHPY